ncbi:hypothetical protein G6F57_019809 [Rhizopus arrhizus]|nr:hypothetical protein G6F57_019809 [Rhizopus arrhizus]
MKALATALMVTATLVGMSAAHADGKTREQVQQELQAAKAAGQVTFGELDYPPKGNCTAATQCGIFAAKLCARGNKCCR